MFELLRGNGFLSSNIWNEELSLSTNAPCIALIVHGFTMANVNMIVKSNDFFKKSYGFHHNLYSLVIKSSPNILKHRPYDLTRGNGDGRRLPVVVFFSDPQLSLNSVLEEDGRFSPSVTGVDGSHLDVGNKTMEELGDCRGLLLVGEINQNHNQT